MIRGLTILSVVLASGIVVGRAVQDFNDRADVTKLTHYEQNIKELKNTLPADKFELIETCVQKNEGGLSAMLSWNNIADSLKKGVSYDSIAKAICEVK